MRDEMKADFFNKLEGAWLWPFHCILSALDRFAGKDLHINRGDYAALKMMADDFRRAFRRH